MAVMGCIVGEELCSSRKALWYRKVLRAQENCAPTNKLTKFV